MKALIIGGGPSITENLKELDRLGEFPGIVLCTDNSVERFILKGWKNFYAVTLEDTQDLDKYYTPDPVMQNGKHILGGFISERVNEHVIESMKKAGIKVDNVPECKGYITSNVGLYCWLIAMMKFNCDEVYMIGMDHCYGVNERPKVDKNSSDPDERELYQYAFHEILNPYNKEIVVLHPANQLWMEEFIWYQDKYPEIKTINCTGRGALFHKSFIWKPISTIKNWNEKL